MKMMQVETKQGRVDSRDHGGACPHCFAKGRHCSKQDAAILDRRARWGTP